MNNYRTLCTPCHQQVTNEMHARLKQQRRSKEVVGVKDIRSMFKPATQKKTKPVANSDVIDLC